MESFIPIEGIQTISLSSTVLSKTFQCSMHQSDESMCIVHSDQFRTMHCAGDAPALIRLAQQAQQQVVIFKTVIAIEDGNILSK